MHVFPKSGVLTRDPVKRDYLPQAGRQVSDHDPYWLRRIADGDVLTNPPDEPAASDTHRTDRSEDV